MAKFKKTVISMPKSEKIFKLEIKGHNSDSRICAGISMLAYTFLQSLYDCRLKIKVEDKDGYMLIAFTKKELKASAHAVDILKYIKFVERGFGLLKETYPENIEILPNYSGFRVTKNRGVLHL